LLGETVRRADQIIFLGWIEKMTGENLGSEFLSSFERLFP